MRFDWRRPAVLALTGALGAAGCTAPDSTTPVSTAPTAASASVNAMTGCDFNAVRAAGVAYLVQPAGFSDLVDIMQAATLAGNQGAALSAGLSALRRVALARNAGLVRAPADGGRAANGVLVCSGESPVPSATALASALATDGSGGIFEVRGGTEDSSSPALALAALPMWGAEPTASGTWLGSLGKRALLYAYRINFGQFTNENPALPPGGSVGTAFEISSVPRIAPLVAPLVVGVCVDDPSSYRLQNVQAIVALKALSFCATPTASAPQSLGDRLLAWVTPKPAYAAAFLGGTGGLISGFSPKGAVDVEVPNVALTFARIPDPRATHEFRVTVHAASVNGYPVENVVVRLSIARNKGNVNDGDYDPLVVTARPTQVNGDVTFIVTLNRPGGYTLRAEGFFNGSSNLPTRIGYSNSFNVRPR